ncbi:hypothetical protein TNCV_2293491 [Trichonephila clavipes]|nr:hypothetical protein TNCV_2293491 [Trichonephila clavipes]
MMTHREGLRPDVLANLLQELSEKESDVGGRTELHIIRNSNLTIQRYANEILRPQVIPHAAGFDGSHLLMQDNAKNHTARLVQKFVEVKTIQSIWFSACFPDLNLIHHAWDSIGRRIQRYHCLLLLSGTWRLHSLKSGNVFSEILPVTPSHPF